MKLVVKQGPQATTGTRLTNLCAGVLAVILAEEIVGIPMTAAVHKGPAVLLLKVKIPAAQIVTAVSCDWGQHAGF